MQEFYIIDTYMYIGLLRVYSACIALQGIAYNQCYEILKNVCHPNFVIFLLLNARFSTYCIQSVLFYQPC